MTILVSYPSSDFITMVSDSSITVHHTSGLGSDSYETDNKFYLFPGIGCITTWGDYKFNNLEMYLQDKKPSKDYTIRELALLVKNYLDEEYMTDENFELGFHIGGFDNKKQAHLYHAYWGFDKPRIQEQKSPWVKMNDHRNDIVYNGRNDLADGVIETFINQIKSGKEIHFDPKTPTGRIRLCDFIARFAAEMTPEVGPPFITHLVFPDNSIERIENKSLHPISLQSVENLLPKLFSLKSPIGFVKVDELSDMKSYPTGTSTSKLLGENISTNEAGTAKPKQSFSDEQGG